MGTSSTGRWTAAAVLLTLYCLLSLTRLVFVDGSGAPDVVGVVLGAGGAAFALARLRGWEGLRR